MRISKKLQKKIDRAFDPRDSSFCEEELAYAKKLLTKQFLEDKNISAKDVLLLLKNKIALKKYVQNISSGRHAIDSETRIRFNKKLEEPVHKKAYANLQRIRKLLAQNGRDISIEELKEEMKTGSSFITFLALDKASQKALGSRALKQNIQIILALATGIASTVLLESFHKTQQPTPTESNSTLPSYEIRQKVERNQTKIDSTDPRILDFFKENKIYLVQRKAGLIVLLPIEDDVFSIQKLPPDEIKNQQVRKNSDEETSRTSRPALKVSHHIRIKSAPSFR